jgi:UPF0716 protein FxsA
VNVFPIFAILFLIVPIVEIYLLIQVGSSIGVFPTILMVIGTAVLGAFLLRQQGLSTLTRFQNNVAKGKAPAIEMLEGIFLLVGGALLMTPGFFTDAVGFLCLLPFSRRAMIYFFLKYSSVKVAKHVSARYSSPNNTGHSETGSVFEGEFTKKDDDKIEHK